MHTIFEVAVNKPARRPTTFRRACVQLPEKSSDSSIDNDDATGF